MIMYKLEDINNTISGMQNNINVILDKGETHLSSDIDKYRSSKQEVMSNVNYTESGKQELANELSIKHCDEMEKAGESFINEIANEYDKAIAEVSTLMQYDLERKIVQEDKKDKVKENTDLLYAIQVLNGVDDEKDSGILKELFEQYQTNEKILNLIKLKANKLSNNGVMSYHLEEILRSIKLLDTDYTEQLKTEKDNKIDFFRKKKYPCSAFSHDLEKIYEVKVGKSILDFIQ